MSSSHFRGGCDGGSREGFGAVGYWMDAWDAKGRKWARVITCAIFLGKRTSLDTELIAAIEVWRAIIVWVSKGMVHFDRHSFVLDDFLQEASFCLKFAPREMGGQN